MEQNTTGLFHRTCRFIRKRAKKCFGVKIASLAFVDAPKPKIRAILTQSTTINQARAVGSVSRTTNHPEKHYPINGFRINS